MKTVLAIAGTLVGSLVSLLSSMVWFFNLTHHDPWLPASPVYIAATALFGVVLSGVGGCAGAVIARGSERGAGEAVAAITLLLAAWSWWESPGQAHWSQPIAIFLMAPAAVLGSRLLAARRLRPANSH